MNSIELARQEARFNRERLLLALRNVETQILAPLYLPALAIRQLPRKKGTWIALGALAAVGAAAFLMTSRRRRTSGVETDPLNDRPSGAPSELKVVPDFR